MLSKLFSLAATGKGAAAAAILATATLGGTAAATNADAMQAVREAGDNVAQLVTDATDKMSEDRVDSDADRADSDKADADKAAPAVVAARNAADKKLRSAFYDDHKALEKLRRTHVDKSDREKLEQLVTSADKQLRARLIKALDEVGALTLGRDGRDADKTRKSDSDKSTTSTDIRATTVDQAKVDVIVAAAIADMKKIVDDTTKAAQALPISNTVKASDTDKHKDSAAEHASDKDKAGEHPGKRP